MADFLEIVKLPLELILVVKGRVNEMESNNQLRSDVVRDVTS